MENKLFQADQLLKLISEEMDIIELEQGKLQATEQTFFSLMNEKDKLMRDLEETWQKGEMNALIQETNDDIRMYERGMSDMLEGQQEELKRNIALLGEKEMRLNYKQKISSNRKW